MEGTGSLLFDVENRKVYCGLSERADKVLFDSFIEKLNGLTKTPFKGVSWHSSDPTGNSVYHTNVVMAILKDHVILCTESIKDPEVRSNVIKELTSPELNTSPKQLIDISYDEMLNMAGNMIMVQSKASGDFCVIMSERARKGLTEANRQILERHYKIISADLAMIETIGGGSARCMVAEIY